VFGLVGRSTYRVHDEDLIGYGDFDDRKYGWSNEEGH